MTEVFLEALQHALFVSQPRLFHLFKQCPKVLVSETSTGEDNIRDCVAEASLVESSSCSTPLVEAVILPSSESDLPAMLSPLSVLQDLCSIPSKYRANQPYSSSTCTSQQLLSQVIYTTVFFFLFLN